jgi:phospholipid/cholesterol/gamma-HCH transport system substrate-binding protein
MEALKYNWLFKSYFEERGYWDAAEYEKEIDRKTKELDEKIELLNKKIDELKLLESSNK